MQCVICYRDFDEYGHSAHPIKSGQCCNKCNTFVVIPKRIKLMRRAAKAAKLKLQFNPEETVDNGS